MTLKKIKCAEQGIQQKVTIEHMAAKSKVPWDDDRPGAFLNCDPRASGIDCFSVKELFKSK